MKLSHFIILFVGIALVLLLPGAMELKLQSTVAMEQIRYNDAVDNAVDDALDAARVEVDDGQSIFINKDEAVNFFFKSMYASFKIQDDRAKQELIKLYVPVLMFTEKDGYYIYHAQEYTRSDGSAAVSYGWTEKRKYSYESDADNLLVIFTLGEDITIYDQTSSERVDGNYKDLAQIYPDVSFFQTESEFEEVRRSCIIGHLTEDMGYFINHHNSVASRYGISYQFSLPAVEKSDWYRTIDDVSLMALFQGYPVSMGYDVTYNRFAIGSARIRKEGLYFVTQESGTMYYHREGCEELVEMDKKEAYFSQKECAQKGAFPHECCK